MNARVETLTQRISSAIRGNTGTVEEISFIGKGELLSAFPVTDFASAVIATAGLAISDLLAATWNTRPTLKIDRRLASLWFGMSIRPIGWKLPPVWDAFAGDYRTRDGWIKLHTNAPHHRAAVMRVVGQYRDRTAMADAVETWIATELETAIVSEGGCAAAMRSAAEWAVHDQGRAVASEPLAHRSMGNSAQFKDWSVTRERPLKGLRVLDLTRVLAGPVATRFLAAFGADVLRIDPPDWDEPAVVQEVTLGKRCARLDLHCAENRKTFEELLSKTHVLVHGYRPTALDRLGFDATTRRALSPGLIDVSLDAYGWTGPWAARRGFDSLVQMSSGIADTGMKWRKADLPVPLPVQALDHATGYLMAALAIRGVTQRLRNGNGLEARVSLARTAKLLMDAGDAPHPSDLAPETAADHSSTIENTAWGDARRVRPPIHIDGTPMAWDYPAKQLGSDKPAWR
jgi:hypothetical protein